MAAVCFVLFLAAVALCLITGHNLMWGLLLGLTLFFLLGLRRGFSPKELAAMAWARGKKSLVVLQVFLTIGMITALWRACGTISFFLYHGLRMISPQWFLLIAFLLPAILSFCLGTSFGVTGTAGIVLITLARSGGVDPAIAAGAIISGAYFGDRCSPMSSCATLVAACTDTDLYHNVREMLKTAALPTLLTILFYAVLSPRNPITTVDAQVLSALSEHVSLHWSTMIPAALMLVLPLLKLPVKWAMSISCAAAFLLAVFLQGMPALDALKAAIVGYQPLQPELAGILSGGGLLSMVQSVGVVFVTGLYAGILEGTHLLDNAHHLSEQLCGRIGLFPTAILVTTALSAVFCNQSVAVLMGEELLGPGYRQKGASRTELAIDIANSGVMLAGLVPWSIAVTIPLAMLDVGMEAILWCALLYLIPLCYLFTKRFFHFKTNETSQKGSHFHDRSFGTIIHQDRRQGGDRLAQGLWRSLWRSGHWPEPVAVCR